jgi:ferredoxin
MKIIHEREKCIGCGACVGVCPDFWEMADDGKSKLIGSKINPLGNYELEVQEPACSQDASDNCPVNIIHIEK